MRSLSSASFLILAIVFFHLISFIEAHRHHKPDIRQFCVPTNQASDTELQNALDFACHQPIDCGPIQPSGVCGNPPTARSRAAFAMNSYFRFKGGNPDACHFSGTGMIIAKDPSYGNCKYV